MSWYGNTSYYVNDYPEMPAVTLEELWMNRHRDYDEDDYYEDRQTEEAQDD